MDKNNVNQSVSWTFLIALVMILALGLFLVYVTRELELLMEWMAIIAEEVPEVSKGL